MSSSPKLETESAKATVDRIHPRRTFRPASARLWIAFLVCAVGTISLFFIPALVIRPFHHQDPRALLLAMTLRQYAPLGTLIAGVATFIFGIMLWRHGSRWRRSFLALALVFVTFSAVMARLNYFEWMFHPVDSPQFLAQANSKLDAKEMILAVQLAQDARAYPISQMAYHHVLNDVVADVPVAVTY